jgi:hypothetical protein
MAKKKKKKAIKKRTFAQIDQNDLAESLARYINPADDEFDLDFTIEMMRLRPDWFSDEERERVASWAKARIMQR